MGVTIVVGGQYGSEGKGKVALDFAKRFNVDYAVRVGGMNSGHTAYRDGKKFVFKTLPTPALESHIKVIIPSGAYFDVENLFEEKKLARLSDDRLIIDPYAVIITEDDIAAEKSRGLIARIGSTGSGTGEAVVNRVLRNEKITFAKDVASLSFFIKDTKKYMRQALDYDKNIIIEGTQGFGLSLLHSNLYPKVTSRDTTAASVLSEVGLSPFDVTDIILTIRAFPIRVAGESGELKNETTWADITKNAGAVNDLTEYTSVTKKVRRVAEFDPGVVKEAIIVNRPSIIVLNHLDYVDASIYSKKHCTRTTQDFIDKIEKEIGRSIEYYGTDPFTCIMKEVRNEYI